MTRPTSKEVAPFPWPPAPPAKVKSTYKLEKGISMPTRRTKLGQTLFEMEVGQSFLAEIGEIIHDRVHPIGKRLGRKFSVRKVEGQMYRVWRVA